ncbi:MAG: hypothetical protein NVSMB65_03760 [Chloroflexota bacterium]
MLRRALIAYGVLCLVVAATLLAVGAMAWVAIDLIVNGVLIVGALAIERGRYRQGSDMASGPWEPTGERFVDPTSGRLMEVRYNRDTGERAYVDVSIG